MDRISAGWLRLFQLRRRSLRGGEQRPARTTILRRQSSASPSAETGNSGTPSLDGAGPRRAGARPPLLESYPRGPRIRSSPPQPNPAAGRCAASRACGGSARAKSRARQRRRMNRRTISVRSERRSTRPSRVLGLGRLNPRQRKNRKPRVFQSWVAAEFNRHSFRPTSAAIL